MSQKDGEGRGIVKKKKKRPQNDFSLHRKQSWSPMKRWDRVRSFGSNHRYGRDRFFDDDDDDGGIF